MADPKDLMTALTDLEGKLTEKYTAYEKMLQDQGSVTNELKGEMKTLAEDFSKMLDDQKKMVAEQKGLMDEFTAIQQHKGQLQEQGKAASIGEQFLESEQFHAFRDGAANHARVTFEQNTIIGESGSPQEPTDDIVAKDYMPGVIAGAFRTLRVLDAVMKGRTGSNTIHYTRELLYTNAAAETAEAAAKPESTLTFEGVDEPVRTIPHFVKVSKQALDDAPFLQSYIDRRLNHGVRQRIETQILTGNGTSPNLSGITTTGNHTDLTVVTADNDFDAANRAKVQVETADFEPSVFICNPVDWGRLERTKTGITNDKTYLGGTAGTIGYLANGLQPMLWGLPVVKSNSLTAGTFICLAMDSLMYVERAGVMVEMFEQDEDNAQRNLVTVRAEARGALAIFRPASIIVGSWPDA